MIESGPAPRPNRIPALDGLRGVAALTVYVSHTANLGWIPGFLGAGNGKMGVGMFFMLSGFLMAWLYAHRPIADVRNYAVSRMARIAPLYLAMVLLSIAFPQALFPITTPQMIAEHLGFVIGVGVLWTIPVEVQFYCLFVLIWISPRRAFPLLVLAQVIAAIAVHQMVPRADLTLPYWLHFFLIGTAFGFIWKRYGEALKEMARPYAKWGWAVLVIALLATPGLRAAIGIHRIPQYVDPLMIGALVLLFAGTLLEMGPLKGFNTAWASWLGKVSYGLYLIHFPVISALAGLPLPGIVLFVLGLAITLVLAALSFSLFEEPVRRHVTSWLSQPRLYPVKAD